jgi:hypothetical protein
VAVLGINLPIEVAVAVVLVAVVVVVILVVLEMVAPVLNYLQHSVILLLLMH